ncbi:MAG: 4Fe-4S binding protein [Treponema sp.]|jgi:epoxyqueuosine reductase|nr:4Fe-4S binding protein [Treponema sp.]
MGNGIMDVNNQTLKENICNMTLNAGFSRVRILARFVFPENSTGALKVRYGSGSPSLLVAALPYGNERNVGSKYAAAEEKEEKHEDIEEKYRAYIAPFAQRNYYKEAVKRLQKLSQTFRRLFGGTNFGCRSGYRIFCNSPIPEKPLALACGLGGAGRNSLVITPEAGSLVIIAAMTLPFPLESDPRYEPRALRLCGTCGSCMEACPTHAIRQEGGIDRNKCIQWYASGNEAAVPQSIIEKWGQRLYGCTVCQDVCPHNKKPIKGTETGEGILPAYVDARKIIAMTDEEIRSFFKGTVMGFSWLKPEHIRRSAGLALKESL